MKDYLSGKTKPSEEMKQEFSGLPLKGNGFFYLSSNAINKVLFELKKNPKVQEMEKYELKQLDDFANNAFFSGVYSLKPEGLTAYFRSPFGGIGQSHMVTVATIGMTSAMILPALGTARAKAQAKKVTNSLKQCGIGYFMYFSDGKYSKIPKDYHKAFEWDLFSFEQANLKFKPQSWDEVFGPTSPWKFFLKPGQSLADVEDPEVPLIAVPEMKNGDKLLVLYGDGHVESKTVPGWKELNLKELKKVNYKRNKNGRKITYMQLHRLK